ncbi:alpha/beta fold hydrolase [Parvularcula sp. ZS-1/3]|uniref:Alpha/beta fold hydrolase n=1 Tax=Parvularcula mediterranea TaxID=2732508 RepID=A0A7Y3RKJ7_9PROT|nr:haloalkane dehalogenase [Parvularcula mediterranea]NNU15072.1 alpha/beta fold hydrolase [Parvularcula mediterranea]
MEALRTPEERFANLPDFPYTPHYLEGEGRAEGLRMAYLDEGPKDAPVFLCLHGEPSWSYLYRKMIPVFLEAGGRVIAPDLYGFGRSDKPVSQGDYSYTFHREALLSLVKRLDLQDITLVCQDWGGVLGLTLPMEEPEHWSRLLVMNTSLPLEPESSIVAEDLARPADERKTGFGVWHAISQKTDDMPVGHIVNTGAGKMLTEAEVAAYDAPFPDKSYKAGAIVFPRLVPFSDSQEGYEIGRRALRFWNDWQGESFMAIGAADPVLGKKAMLRLQGEIKGCPPPLIIEEGGHFVQEWGDQIAKAALESFAKR